MKTAFIMLSMLISVSLANAAPIGGHIKTAIVG
jgi:hypothetical protein